MNLLTGFTLLIIIFTAKHSTLLTMQGILYFYKLIVMTLTCQSLRCCGVLQQSTYLRALLFTALLPVMFA